MKRWVHNESTTEIKSNNKVEKLKRTAESGHSYDSDITFDTPEAYLKWCEEDKLYED